jgi:hypothetical protein
VLSNKRGPCVTYFVRFLAFLYFDFFIKEAYEQKVVGVPAAIRPAQLEKQCSYYTVQRKQLI